MWGRIIPALAGNTGHDLPDGPAKSDHPRSRGEYLLAGELAPAGGGSSPLSRGILLHRQAALGQLGIIPALAGNTSSMLPPPSFRWDHPRSRGEYLPRTRGLWKCSGSSPLSRGIPDQSCAHISWAGIIPALAGNTSTGVRPGGHARDHPRSRGEYLGHCSSLVSQWGSSPLSRGIPSALRSIIRLVRIIPALAGNTNSMVLPDPKTRDHPRSRGEYAKIFKLLTAIMGSSPLSRGILKPFMGVREIGRIIPALAGNTCIFLWR